MGVTVKKREKDGCNRREELKSINMGTSEFEDQILEEEEDDIEDETLVERVMALSNVSRPLTEWCEHRLQAICQRSWRCISIHPLFTLGCWNFCCDISITCRF